MQKLSLIFLLIFLSACGVKLTKIEEKTITRDEFNDLNISRTWWKAYNNEKINEFMTYILANNSDINVARTTLLTMIANANLIDYDMYPTLSANFGISKSKNLNTGITNSRVISNNLNLSYELDIYGKIVDETKAAEFNAIASAYDLENLKLSILNSAINGIFELAYFNDVDILLKDYVANLEQMRKLYVLKYELGKVEELELLSVEQSLLNAKQNLLSNEQNKNTLIKTLKDLIGDESGFSYIEYFSSLSLKDFVELKPNYDLPLNFFSYRPDVKSKIHNLYSAFKDYTSVQKSILPSISLSGGLSGSDESLKNSFKFEVLSGSILINLPFLDYGRVRQNIKISQFAYETLLFEYVQILQSAINEFWLNTKDYQSYIALYANLQDIYTKQEQITNSYYQKYSLGKSELKDYLDANNSLNSTAQELLRSRYNLLSTINSYYQITTIEYENIGISELER
ncbi:MULTISPECIES: TolC family protein [unclassified Campylobacter]|uniref:TolC family protein n=1 Tax=unclassified Campylobacter TaxID=2593542 RepID=UPI001237C227|nr:MULTISPECIES: TolC family protein [unclassified Campylobacter]KAA6224694.1 TolC family protein [Campylobacter sp. LR185c]KAA6225692.1 TolC family protein [Campylobacter sp. LR286c]KAA6225812.1 TolC family protein [Campylobacter sp. LR196d]KAA6229665.1 TolC family protein [Campylobacter sp. LR291e]KAA6230089.1 TolC family protein [Campylobacter sp. LR264d]